MFYSALGWLWPLEQFCCLLSFDNRRLTVQVFAVLTSIYFVWQFRTWPGTSRSLAPQLCGQNPLSASNVINHEQNIHSLYGDVSSSWFIWSMLKLEGDIFYCYIQHLIKRTISLPFFSVHGTVHFATGWTVCLQRNAENVKMTYVEMTFKQKTSSTPCVSSEWIPPSPNLSLRSITFQIHQGFS